MAEEPPGREWNSFWPVAAEEFLFDAKKTNKGHALKTNLPVTQREKPFPKGCYLLSRTDLKSIATYVTTRSWRFSVSPAMNSLARTAMSFAILT